MTELELRVAWERHIATWTTSGSSAAFDSVLGRHHEAHRHYHTLTHVTWVLRHLDSFGHVDFDRQLAAGAAFFHDIVYDPRRDDNEAASARVAVSMLSDVGWPDDRCQHVARLIEATAHLADQHPPDSDDAPSADITCAAVCTADLAILAADPIEYRDYVTQIRREYGHLTNDEWQAGRAAVLDGFANSVTIFDPRVAPPGWEQRARANIASERATLSTR